MSEALKSELSSAVHIRHGLIDELSRRRNGESHAASMRVDRASVLGTRILASLRDILRRAQALASHRGGKSADASSPIRALFIGRRRPTAASEMAARIRRNCHLSTVFTLMPQPTDSGMETVCLLPQKQAHAREPRKLLNATSSRPVRLRLEAWRERIQVARRALARGRWKSGAETEA